MVNEINEQVLSLLIATTIVTYWVQLANFCLSLLAFLFNFFHFTILVRKELRSNAIFLLILSICCSDLIRLLTLILYNFKKLQNYQKIDFCFGYDTVLGTFLEMIRAYFTMVTSSICSWLTIVLAFFRTFVVLFPLSPLAETLFQTTKSAKKCVLFIVLFAIFGNLWEGIQQYGPKQITKNDLCLVPVRFENWKDYKVREDQFTKSITPTNLIFNANARALRFVAMIRPVFHIVLSIILVITIRKAAKRRKGMRSTEQEKSNNSTTVLITLMSFFYFVSEFFGSLVEYGNEFVPATPLSEILTFHVMFGDMIYFLAIINSLSQFFLCYFLSSQYQEVVRRVLKIKKNSNISNHNYNRVYITDETYFCPDRDDGCAQIFPMRLNRKSIIKGVADHIASVHQRKKFLQGNCAFFVRSGTTETTVSDEELDRWFEMKEPRPTLFEFIQFHRKVRDLSLKELEEMRTLSIEMVRSPFSFNLEQAAQNLEKWIGLSNKEYTLVIMDMVKRMKDDGYTFCRYPLQGSISSSRWLLWIISSQLELDNAKCKIHAIDLIEEGRNQGLIDKVGFKEFLEGKLKFLLLEGVITRPDQQSPMTLLNERIKWIAEENEDWIGEEWLVHGSEEIEHDFIRIRVTTDEYFCSENDCPTTFEMGTKYEEIVDHICSNHGRDVIDWNFLELFVGIKFVRQGSQEFCITNDELKAWINADERPD